MPSADPGKDSDKKDAEELPDPLCTHNQKCHGDRGLCTFHFVSPPLICAEQLLVGSIHLWILWRPP
jgi:hypothetical protein